MEIEIASNFLPLPKEANFRKAIKMMMKTNHIMTKLKNEIFVKLKRRFVLIIPMIISDFKDARKISVKNIHTTCLKKLKL